MKNNIICFLICNSILICFQSQAFTQEFVSVTTASICQDEQAGGFSFISYESEKISDDESKIVISDLYQGIIFVKVTTIKGIQKTLKLTKL